MFAFLPWEILLEAIDGEIHLTYLVFHPEFLSGIVLILQLDNVIFLYIYICDNSCVLLFILSHEYSHISWLDIYLKIWYLSQLDIQGHTFEWFLLKQVHLVVISLLLLTLLIELFLQSLLSCKDNIWRAFWLKLHWGVLTRWSCSSISFNCLSSLLGRFHWWFCLLLRDEGCTTDQDFLPS